MLRSKSTKLGFLVQVQLQYVAEIIWHLGPALQLLFEYSYQGVTLRLICINCLILALSLALYVTKSVIMCVKVLVL